MSYHYDFTCACRTTDFYAFVDLCAQADEDCILSYAPNHTIQATYEFSHYAIEHAPGFDNTTVFQLHGLKYGHTAVENFNKLFEAYFENPDTMPPYNCCRVGECRDDHETIFSDPEGVLAAYPEVISTINVVHKKTQLTIKPGMYVCYHRRDTNHYELGFVKKRNYSDTGWFVWYHEGDTAANTPDDCLIPLRNQDDPFAAPYTFSNRYCKPTELGGATRKKLFGA